MTERDSHQSLAEVIGHSAVNRPAALRLRLIAVMVDLVWIAGIYGLGVCFFDLSPLPSLNRIVIFLFMILILWTIQWKVFGATIGQWIWKLKYIPSKKNSQLIQTEHLTFSNLSFAIFLTVISFGISSWITMSQISNHPLFAVATLESMNPHQATSAHVPSDKTEWIELPFFYTFGMWPKKFQDHPVLYQFPYEKGPPHFFPGHIIANWDHPSIQMTLLGPSTPKHFTSIESLKKCVTNSSFTSLSCLKIRNSLLSKHLTEMKRITVNHWKMRWFQIDTPVFTSQEKPAGIHLSAEGESGAQDRYIFILSSGATQTFILDRPLTLDGDEAKRVFETSIMSQRISSNLSTGKAHIDRELALTKLEELEKVIQDTNAFLSKMGEIQALLLSKISVDPKAFDAYFHLGGTALLFAKQGLDLNNPEWSALAKPLVASALKYAEDISPQDPRTDQLRLMYKSFSVSK